MAPILISTFFLSIFSFFNLLGIAKELISFQLIYFSIGVIVFIIIKRLGLSFFRNNSKSFYYLFIALLILTFFIGPEVRGSKRWIDLYFFNFQASEFFKIFFVLFLADYFVKNKDEADQRKVFLGSLTYFLIPFLIIFKEPDLGNAIIYIFIYTILLLFSNISKKYIFYLIVFSIIILPLGWFTLKDYQKQRITTFISPQVDLQGSSYNRFQSIITVGSGKFLGRGLGLGTQTKLFYLPENHTDFAFASLVEQFGFIGGASVIGLFFTIIYVFILKALNFYNSKDDYGKFSFLFVLGILSYLSFQILINIGMNLGLLPIVGVVLPIISYGGSAFVTFLLGLALIP
ncbi:rod shape-determining protein RodA [Candidatus Roizmanbacteria bacterium]|nr:rod shape-determining protein RodA [Candidatus Roizmanbacteria bacterium]